MERSRLERMPDVPFKKFVDYLLKHIEIDDDMSNFYMLFDPNTKLGKILNAPIGSLSRLDIEYIYWILDNNDTDELDPDTFERPTLTTKEVTHVEEFVAPKTIQRSKDLPTYVSNEVGSYYLNQLVVNDEIDIFSWEVVFDKEGDIDFIEDYFIVK